ncbi:hypothetical protein WR25_18270 [Diploscapter pachys]|uniref:Uncharacterized protein n=1 Tax=Diploscapter pachys TaxID=2018661 RepID=A0A2A2LMZ2_9BILA|nr:hypothetical protein WR25_18270 [Diploscapter pachys]
MAKRYRRRARPGQRQRREWGPRREKTRHILEGKEGKTDNERLKNERLQQSEEEKERRTVSNAEVIHTWQGHVARNKLPMTLESQISDHLEESKKNYESTINYDNFTIIISILLLFLLEMTTIHISSLI